MNTLPPPQPLSVHKGFVRRSHCVGGAAASQHRASSEIRNLTAHAQLPQDNCSGFPPRVLATMAYRGKDASLEDQMARLHNNMSARDKRRAQQQEMRQVCEVPQSSAFEVEQI